MVEIYPIKLIRIFFPIVIQDIVQYLQMPNLKYNMIPDIWILYLIVLHSKVKLETNKGNDTLTTFFHTEIGEKIGPFDLSLIPIGAYSPRWFMSPIHCSPEDAVEVHKDIKSKRSVSKNIHNGNTLFYSHVFSRLVFTGVPLF